MTHAVYVTPVEDPTAAIPGWDGEMIPLPFDLAQTVGQLRAEIDNQLEDHGKDELIKKLAKQGTPERFGIRKIVEELIDHKKIGAPVPTHERVVIEAFENYLIIHACFGDRVNNTLGEVYEELLSRKGIVRQWWADGYRILIELTTTPSDLVLDEIQSTLFDLEPGVMEGIFNGILHRHFPFGYYMKFIAERFGALNAV